MFLHLLPESFINPTEQTPGNLFQGHEIMNSSAVLLSISVDCDSFSHDVWTEPCHQLRCFIDAYTLKREGIEQYAGKRMKMWGGDTPDRVMR